MQFNFSRKTGLFAGHFIIKGKECFEHKKDRVVWKSLRLRWICFLYRGTPHPPPPKKNEVPRGVVNKTFKQNISAPNFLNGTVLFGTLIQQNTDYFLGGKIFTLGWKTNSDSFRLRYSLHRKDILVSNTPQFDILWTHLQTPFWFS